MARAVKAKAERVVTTEQARSVAFPQGDLFRMEVRRLADDLIGAFLRTCRAAAPGQLIGVEVRISLLTPEDGAEQAS